MLTSSLNLAFESLTNALPTFKNKFVQDMAQALQVDKARIVVLSVIKGSVLVSWYIKETLNKTQTPTTTAIASVDTKVQANSLVSDLPCNVRREGRVIPCNWRAIPCDV